MAEALPVAFGIVVGLLLGLVPRALPRLLAYPLASAGAAVLASYLNGELAEEGWAVFVSFDAALVWLSAGLTVGAVLSARRLRATA